jgi:hypothetical protein
MPSRREPSLSFPQKGHPLPWIILTVCLFLLTVSATTALTYQFASQRNPVAANPDLDRRLRNLESDVRNLKIPKDMGGPTATEPSQPIQTAWDTWPNLNDGSHFNTLQIAAISEQFFKTFGVSEGGTSYLNLHTFFQVLDRLAFPKELLTTFSLHRPSWTMNSDTQILTLAFTRPNAFGFETRNGITVHIESATDEPDQIPPCENNGVSIPSEVLGQLAPLMRYNEMRFDVVDLCTHITKSKLELFTPKNESEAATYAAYTYTAPPVTLTQAQWDGAEGVFPPVRTAILIRREAADGTVVKNIPVTLRLTLINDAAFLGRGYSGTLAQATENNALIKRWTSAILSDSKLAGCNEYAGCY